MPMKRIYTISLSLAVLLLALSNTYAQTITSTLTGGNWETASTWVGGSVPGASNDVVIAGIVSVTNSSSTCRSLTVNSGATLQNGGGLGWVTFVVRGDITNNGTIRDNPAGNTLCLDLRGDISNAGEWRNSNTYVATKQVQHISMAVGTKFEREFAIRDGNGAVDTNGSLIATSDLVFANRFDLHWRTIDLAGHKLSLLAAANMAWGTILNASDIYCRDSSYFYNTIVAGTITTLHGVVRIDAAVSFVANIVNQDTMQHTGGLGWVTPVFYGDLTNNGLIRDNPITHWQLALDLRGDVINNGTWSPASTYLATTRLQHISATAGKPFQNDVTIRDGNGRVDTNGSLVAGSDLTFTGTVNLNWRWIDMTGHALTLDKHGHVSWGTIQNVPTIYCRDSSAFYNTIVKSDVVLRGTAHIDGAVTFLGDVVVVDTMQHWGGLGWVTPEIHGSFTNNGLVRNNPENNWGLALRVWKDVTNNGIWTAQQIIMDGTARRTVLLRNATGTRVSVAGKKVALVNDNVVPTLEMGAGAICYVASEATLLIEDGTTNYGWNGVDNLGCISIPKKTVAGTTRYEAYYASVYFPDGAAMPDSVIVQSFGRQTPKAFGNAVERWFRIRTQPSTDYPLRYLDISYGQMDLNGNAERDLRLYRSTDNGATWIMIENAKLLYIDSSSNYLRYQGVPCSGDYVLASGDMVPVPSRANIRVSIVGNGDLRVGAPNRLLVHLYNNSDAVSGDLFVTLESNEKIRFVKLEDEVDGVMRTLGVDEFAYDSSDQSILLLANSLGAREERDLTFYATPISASSISSKHDKPQIIWFIAAAAVYIAGAVITDYITDRAVQACFDAWMPANASASDKALAAADIKAALKEGAKMAPISTGKKLAEDGATKILANKGLKHLLWPAKLGYNILSCIENTVKGLQCYQGQTMIKDVFTHVECNGSQKEVRPVVSKDPNHKSGPFGIGPNGFVASTARSEYMIEFENAPSAEAAAYKIVVIDTLSENFDPATVTFGRMSHAFTPTREGRILRWEITGIDLPANKVPPEGEGWLTFSVMPKSGLPTGTQLANRASITFDLNAPILTNTYINTLDFAPPITTMAPMPSHTPDTLVTIRWTSIDPTGGSGYESAEIFMAVDAAQYHSVAVQNSDSARMILPLGHTYSFYALAKDAVGNLEMVRPTPVSVRVTSAVADHSSAAFWLRQPYPNPSNGSIDIEYSLPQTGYVRVSVVDVLGHDAIVTRILRAEGFYQDRLSTELLPAGTYFVRIQQGSEVRSQKFVIER